LDGIFELTEGGKRAHMSIELNQLHGIEFHLGGEYFQIVRRTDLELSFDRDKLFLLGFEESLDRADIRLCPLMTGQR
jgi:hypothetical protein